MGIGVSIFLFALGAILAFAVHVNSQGLDINTVGVILMIVGLIGAVFSALFWSSWGGFRRPYPASGYAPPDRIVEERRVPVDRVVEERRVPADRVVEERRYP